jgi:hypothetical protein
MDPGRGEVIRLTLNAAGQVESLDYGEFKFVKKG